jgi:hypothetical protein
MTGFNSGGDSGSISFQIEIINYGVISSNWATSAAFSCNAYGKSPAGCIGAGGGI